MWKKAIGSNEERPGHYDLWGYASAIVNYLNYFLILKIRIMLP